MMKAGGMRPETAGAVEAAASSAGQFIPPVMGAVAFMLAQPTGAPYLLVCVAAIVPATAYLVSLFLGVWPEAKRDGLGGVSPAEMPRLGRADLVASITFAVPTLVVIGVMATGRSPAMAGFWATLAAAALGFLNPEVRRRPLALVEALARGGLSAARIMAAVGAIGIAVAGMNLTGLGLGFAQAVSALADGQLAPALLLTAAACAVLGMGMPTLPAYLIIVLVMGPALAQLGAPKLAVHMFVLCFAALSAITPPVALAAFAAAPLAGAGPMRVAVASVRLTLIGCIVPFLFVLNPSLLIVAGFDPDDFALGIARLAAVVWLLNAALAGHALGPLPPLLRAAHAAGAALLLLRDGRADAAGFALPALLVATQLPALRRLVPVPVARKEGSDR